MVSGYDYAIIVFYLGFLSFVGLLFRRFNVRTADYFAGGFRMNWWLVGASAFMTNFSCWSFTGAAYMAYTYGMLIFAFYAVDVLGYVAAWFWFAPRFRQLRVVTAIEAVRLRFGATAEQFYLWVAFLAGLGSAVVWLISLSVIVSSAFQISGAAVIVVVGAVTILLALVGGNWAVAAGHFVQMLVLSAVTLMVAVLAVMRVGGWGAFVAQIPADHWRVFHPAGSIPYDWLYLVTGFFSALYTKNNLMTAAKYVAAKDSVHARRSVLIPLAGYVVMPVIWLIPPLAAFTIVPELAHAAAARAGEASYIDVCVRILPHGAVGLLIVCMFSVTMGTLAATLNRNAGFFVRSFYRTVLRPTAGDPELLVAGRLATMTFGGLVTFVALLVTTRAEVTLFDASLYVGAFLTVPVAVPLALGLVVRRVPRWAGWGATVFGLAVTSATFLYAPTPLGAATLAPLLGDGVYGYMLSNKFVMTNLVVAPLIALFFLTTRWWYRPEPEYDRAVGEFFRRRDRPVDFEAEVGRDTTPVQARLIGRLTLAYGAFIAALAAVPNPAWGRLSLLGCALVPLTVGAALLRFARRAAA